MVGPFVPIAGQNQSMKDLQVCYKMLSISSIPDT